MAFSRILLRNILLLSFAVLGISSSDESRATNVAQSSDAVAYVTLCRGAAYGCANYPMTLQPCVDLAGDKAQYFKAVAAVVIPHGFTCSLHDRYNCVVSANPSSAVTLESGSYDLSVDLVPNIDGRPINFNRLAASYKCYLAQA